MSQLHNASKQLWIEVFQCTIWAKVSLKPSFATCWNLQTFNLILNWTILLKFLSLPWRSIWQWLESCLKAIIQISMCHTFEWIALLVKWLTSIPIHVILLQHKSLTFHPWKSLCLQWKTHKVMKPTWRSLFLNRVTINYKILWS